MLNIIFNIAAPRTGKTTSCKKYIEGLPQDTRTLVIAGSNNLAKTNYSMYENVTYRGATESTPPGTDYDVIIVDDIIKNQIEAQDKKYVDHIFDGFMLDFARLAPQGTIVIVGSRWNQDDFIGRVLHLAERVII